ncbi:MAG: UDP-N-acetylmuramate dehydrogenase [Candidatus Saganbacteria bacterium]|nr:UDP-N-acetylmuramate dehydrogenase [Candidatus Saganbacteria bacterium]
MGAGSNVLFQDKGFPGVVIKMACGPSDIEIEGNTVKVQSGMMLPKLIKFLARMGLDGLEFSAGVPASIGGAAAMNMGAYGSEISKFIKSVKVMNMSGQEKILAGRDLGFGYRSSSINSAKYIITEITLKLQRGKPKNIRKQIKKLINLRRSNQPISTPNAGSVFKNPDGFYAGKLIEEAGAKGMRVGDAQVSKKHANFIINLGVAKAKDVLEIIEKVKDVVHSKFNIDLEPEIKIV